MTKPLPPPLLPPEAPFYSRDWRPRSELLDTVVPLLYYFLSAAACADSAWGMLMCAEWGVRGGTMPADLYEKFVRQLRPDPNDAEMSDNTMWVWRCFEPRAVHEGLRFRGLFCMRHCGFAGLNLGFAQSPSWDPFYFVDRTVMTLFLASACLVYLNNGLLPAAVIVFFFASLRSRVQGKGQAVLRAMFRTLGDAAQEDGMELTEAEKAQATSTGTARHSEAWKKSILAAKAKSLKRQNTRSFSQEAAGASDMTA